MQKEIELPTVELNNELKFVIAMSVKNMTDFQKKTAFDLLHAGLDWNEISLIVTRNSISPQFMKNIKALNLMDETNDVLVKFEQQAKGYALKSLKLAGELKKIITALENNGIEVLSLKGPVLAHQIYGNIAMRMSGDLDILIDKKDLLKVWRIIENQGFALMFEENISTHTRFRNFLLSSHHMVFARGSTFVELHWRIENFDVINFSTVYNNSQNNKFNGTDIKTMPTLENLLFLIVHGAKHGYSSLRWLLDIYEIMVQRDFDIEELYCRAVELEVDLMLLQSLTVINLIGIFSIDEIRCGNYIFTEDSIIIDTKHKTNSKYKQKYIAKLAYLALDVINNYKVLPENVTKSKEFLKYRFNYMLALKKQKSIIRSRFRTVIYPNHLDFDIINLPDYLYWLYFIISPFFKLHRTLFKK